MTQPTMLPVSSPQIPAWARERLSPKLPGHWWIMYWDHHPRYKAPAFSIEMPYIRLEYTEADFRAFDQPGGA